MVVRSTSLTRSHRPAAGRQHHRHAKCCRGSGNRRARSAAGGRAGTAAVPHRRRLRHGGIPPGHRALGQRRPEQRDDGRRVVAAMCSGPLSPPMYSARAADERAQFRQIELATAHDARRPPPTACAGDAGHAVDRFGLGRTRGDHHVHRFRQGVRAAASAANDRPASGGTGCPRSRASRRSAAESGTPASRRRAATRVTASGVERHLHRVGGGIRRVECPAGASRSH